MKKLYETLSLKVNEKKIISSINIVLWYWYWSRLWFVSGPFFRCEVESIEVNCYPP